jgi:formyltetrahydrofolate synthetase
MIHKIQMSRLAKLLEPRKQLLGYRSTRAESEALPDVILSDIITMPGLPKVPSTEVIGLDDKGLVQGLY